MFVIKHILLVTVLAVILAFVVQAVAIVVGGGHSPWVFSVIFRNVWWALMIVVSIGRILLFI